VVKRNVEVNKTIQLDHVTYALLYEGRGWEMDILFDINIDKIEFIEKHNYLGIDEKILCEIWEYGQKMWSKGYECGMNYNDD
jgi:hypothetical protein